MKFPLIIENNVLIKYDAPTNGNDEVIVIPDGVTEIAKWAFARCFDVKEIIIPDTVEIIGERAFFDCRLLKKVVLPSRLKAIGNETFCLCHSLEDTVIPEGVESIGPEAFYECKNLKKITLPKTLKYIGMRAFFSAYIDTVVFTGTKEEWETIDKGFEWRGRSSFDICFAGERAPLDPEKISEDFVIENGVLVNYTGSDSNITVPEGITAIGDHVFSNSGSLYSVTLPDSITEVGTNPFPGCDNLTKINVSPDHPALAVVDGVLGNRMEALSQNKLDLKEGTLTAESIALSGQGAISVNGGSLKTSSEQIFATALDSNGKNTETGLISFSGTTGMTFMRSCT